MKSPLPFFDWWTRSVRIHNRTLQLNELLSTDRQTACSAAYYAGQRSALESVKADLENAQKTIQSLQTANRILAMANEALMQQRDEWRLTTFEFAKLTRVK